MTRTMIWVCSSWSHSVFAGGLFGSAQNVTSWPLYVPCAVPLIVNDPAVLNVTLQANFQASPRSSLPSLFVSPPVLSGVQVAPEGVELMVTDGFSSGDVPSVLSLVSVNVKVTLSPLWTRMSFPAFGAGEVERLSVVLGLHVLKGMTSKSFNVAVNDPEDRVCGMNVLMHPVNPSDSKLTAPSINSFWGMDATTFPLLSRQAQPPQGTAVAPALVTAAMASTGTPGAHPAAGIGLHTSLASLAVPPGQSGFVPNPLVSMQATSW